MAEFDKTKFSFVELFLNSNGKTSITKLIGFASSFVCIIMFVIMLVFYMINVGESEVIIVFIDRIITFFGISAGLMGIKSISSSFGKDNKIEMNNSEEKKKKNPQHGHFGSEEPEGDE